MANALRSIESLQNAVGSVCKEISRMRLQTREWQDWTEDELWRELAGCILGSRVPYEQAVAAVSYLNSSGILYLRSARCNLARYEVKLRGALSQPIFPSNKRSAVQKYRFPVLRAHHLRRTAEAIYLQGNSLGEILKSSGHPMEARTRIMSVAIGIGPKQASLFLQNVGYADDLAILDKHVLQYMIWIKLTPAHGINRITTFRGYLHTEEAFSCHARQMGVSVANLDLAIWVVVRVIQSELKREPGKPSVRWN